MKNQPNRDYVSNDVVQTPLHLAERIVKHFKPEGRVLEPCAGDGAFSRALLEYPAVESVRECEILRGVDFLTQADEDFDWIVTNPPWSQIRPFLAHSMELAYDVVFLMTVNHVWTKARMRDVKAAGFGIKEICLCEMPKEFPQSGFQLGAIHFQQFWAGDIRLSDISRDDPTSG